MKRIALVVGVIASLAVGQAAQAGTISFGDSTIHWNGFDSSNTVLNTLDAINWPDYSGGSATITDGALNRVDFFDTVANHNPSGTFDQYLHSGDLFIDLKADGTWDYLVKTSGIFSAGNYGLYNITNLGVTTNSTDASKYIMGNVRDGQPIGLLSTSGATYLGDVVGFSGYYDAAIQSYSSYFDFGSSAIDLGNSNFIVGYSPLCGNDVVLEQVPVPEPGTMVLLGFGMLGMAIYGKRRMKKDV